MYGSLLVRIRIADIDIRPESAGFPERAPALIFETGQRDIYIFVFDRPARYRFQGSEPTAFVRLQAFRIGEVRTLLRQYPPKKGERL